MQPAQGFKKYFFNTSWMVAENLLRLVVGFFVGVYVARYLGPEDFGALNYALAFVGLFGAIANLGMNRLLIREFVNCEDEANEVLGTAFWLRIITSLVLLPIIWLISLAVSHDAQTSIFVMIVALGLTFQSFEVLEFFFQARVQARYVSLCKIVQLLCMCALKLYLIFTGAALLWFVFITLVGHILLAAFLTFAFYSKESLGFFFRFSKARARGLLNDSWLLILSGIVIMIYLRADQIMLRFMLGEESVGMYSAAIKVSEIWYFIPTIVTNSLFPSIISARKVSDELFLRRVRSLFDFFMISGILLSLIFALFSDRIVILLYGQSFAPAASVLAIHIWTGIFFAFGFVSGSWFIVDNMQKTFFYRNLACAVINILLNLALIPLYGIKGAAVATLVAQACAFFLFNAFSRETSSCFKLQCKAFFSCGLCLLRRKNALS